MLLDVLLPAVPGLQLEDYTAGRRFPTIAGCDCLRRAPTVTRSGLGSRPDRRRGNHYPGSDEGIAS